MLRKKWMAEKEKDGWKVAGGTKKERFTVR